MIQLGTEGAEAMDQQDNDARERTIDQRAPKEHRAVSDEDDFDVILLGRREELRGSTPGNVRVRITLPRHQAFQRIKEGVLEATEAARCQKGRLLYSPKILGLKTTLLFRPEIVVANVPLQQGVGTSTIPTRPEAVRHRFIVPLAGLDRAALASLAYARSIFGHVIAMHVVAEDEQVEQIRASWQQWQQQVAAGEETHLLLIESPYRSLLRPLLAYIDAVHLRHPEDTLTVILPEFVVAHWWEYPLHNQTAVRLKAALVARPGLVVTDIPQHLRHRPQRDRKIA
jgi:hypothetical protein